MGEAAEILVGERVADRYRIEKVLESNQRSSVYLGTDLDTYKSVAIKVLRDASQDDRRQTARFERHVRTLDQLSHPNIVSAYDSGADRQLDVLFLVLEFVHGVKLDDLLEFGGLVPSAATAIGLQVSHALQAVHRHRIIHRNLEPGNLVLSVEAGGSVTSRLVGFGTARFASGGTEITREGEVVGAAQYAAPEQVSGGTITSRSDLYGLGALLFHTLSGEPLFAGGASRVQVMYKQAKVDPQGLRERMSSDEVPESLADLIDELLEKNPEQRPGSMDEVYSRLSAIRDALDPLPRVFQERDFAKWLADDVDPDVLFRHLKEASDESASEQSTEAPDNATVVDLPALDGTSDAATEVIPDVARVLSLGDRGPGSSPDASSDSTDSEAGVTVGPAPEEDDAVAATRDLSSLPAPDDPSFEDGPSYRQVMDPDESPLGESGAESQRTGDRDPAEREQRRVRSDAASQTQRISRDTLVRWIAYLLVTLVGLLIGFALARYTG